MELEEWQMTVAEESKFDNVHNGLETNLQRFKQRLRGERAVPERCTVTDKAQKDNNQMEGPRNG